MPDANNELHMFQLLLNFPGGLALFLFGMVQMTSGLKSLAGEGMRSALAVLTKNRFTAAISGALVTAACQSSSVTTVLLVGFISAGLMSLSQSVGVIMGANIGSTVTAQLIAFKITHYALPMLAVGFTLLVLSRRDFFRQLGSVVLGLGLIFLGMDLMSELTMPLRTYPPFITAMRTIQNPLIAILISAAITAIVQSSAATTGVVIVLASQGFVSLESGIALALGANIGTCVTAVLAALGKPRTAMQAAAVHVLFNCAGVLLWLPFLTPLADIVRWISPVASDLEGAARVAAEAPRQIANAHTLFNVANTAIFIWFTGPTARFVAWLIREKPEEAIVIVRPKYIDDVYLETPSMALERINLELGHLGQCVSRMLTSAPAAVATGTRHQLEHIRQMDESVDTLYGAILGFVRKLARQPLLEKQSTLLEDQLQIANYLESIGDLIETNLVAQGLRRVDYNFRLSPGTREVLRPLAEAVQGTVDLAIQATTDADPAVAKDVVGRKAEIEQLANDATQHLSRRLRADEPNRVRAFQVEADMISQYKRIYYYAKRIAKVVLGEDSLAKSADTSLAEAAPVESS